MSSPKRAWMSETFRMGVLLTLVGGYLDSYTYFTRGGVFANAQTGNIVLLGIHAVRGEWRTALNYLVPVLAFTVGVFTAEEFRHSWRHRTVHWRQISLLSEMLFIFAVAFMPESMDMLANITVSFICAVQVQTFRKLHGAAYATTMCTGNLRSGSELLYRYFREGDKQVGQHCLAYFGIILVFILGVMLGAVGAYLWKELSILACIGVLMGAFLLMFYQRPVPPETGKPCKFR